MASQEDLPRALDVQRFAETRKAEISSLEACIKEAGTQWGIKAMPRHWRRRATSHNSCVHKRRPNRKLQQARAQAKAAGQAGTLCNRAMRRRKARLQQGIVYSLAAGPVASGSGKPRMLETHVWHAKRMQMATRWGHKLAQGAPGKGHGSRAFLHTLRHGVTIHDASYWLALELSGPCVNLVSVLTSLCGTEAMAALMASAEAMQGLWEAELVLHHPHLFPQKAIAPAKILYQGDSIQGAAQPKEEADNGAEHVKQSMLLLSVHAAAHGEAQRAISQAAADCGVAVRSRGDLQRVELQGVLSDRALAAALHLADEPGLPILPTAPESQISRRLFRLLQATGGATGSEQASNAVLRVRVRDPRLAKPNKPLADATEESRLSATGPGQLPDNREEMREARALAKQLSTEDTSALIWEAHDMPQPLSEAAVSSYRQQQKLAGLLLQSNPPESLPLVRSSCPILMARQAPKDRRAVPSWTLTVPSGWVSQIWQALTYQGARPAGQREWRWAAMQQNKAFFPHDYPDTLAYSQLAAELAAEQDAQRLRRPKGRCSEGTPHPPRWDLLGASMTIPAGSSEPRPLKAPTIASAPEEDQSVISPAVGLPSSQLQVQCASIAAGEAQNAVLKEGHVQAPTPEEEPASMEVDGGAHCLSTSDARTHLGHINSRTPAPLFVASSQNVLLRCLQHQPQRHHGYQPSSQEAVTVATAESGPGRSAGLGGSMGAGARCMVRISLQTLGPGVPNEGAAILSLSPEEAASIRRSMLGHKLHPKDSQGEDSQKVRSLKEALSGFQKKQLNEQRCESGQASEAASGEPASAPAQPAEAGQQTRARVLMGFVTSEAPRGLLGRGACGLCLGASLGAQRMQQTPGKEDSGVLVAYRSPLSSVLRLAEAKTAW